MITEITIKNFAIIEEIKFEFGNGLNVLTGETGSGKSIITNAIGILTGGKTSSEIIRTGENLAVIEAKFELSPPVIEHLKLLLSSQEIEAPSSELSLRREIHASGRTRAFIDDQSITAKSLKIIGPYLVELHMQGEQYLLSSQQNQLEFLDEYCRCVDERKEIERLFAERRAIEQQLDDLRIKLREYERTKDYLNFQIAEIDAISPIINEDVDLMNERTTAINHSKVRALEQAIYQGIYESDESITSQLVSIRRYLSELAVFDNRVADSLESFDGAVVTLTDIAETFRSADAPKISSERLNEIEDRLAKLEKLKRKYGATLSDVLAAKNEMNIQLHELCLSEDLITTLQTRLTQCETSYFDNARRLSGRRSEGAVIMSKDVTSRLPEVALSDALFQVVVTSAVEVGKKMEPEVTNKDGWSKRGIDTVEFFFTANQGENLRMLAEVASGGELSRLALTLHNVLHDRLSRETTVPATLVFDEIDSGISGGVAERVGRKLADLSKNLQIICITHQPQIARFATNHFKISKALHDGRTKTFVRKLQDEHRTAELASMITADESVHAAQETAEWLLSSAGQDAPSIDKFNGVGKIEIGSGKSRKRKK